MSFIDQHQQQETAALLPPDVTVQVQTYIAISQDPETGNLVVTQKEKKSWFWTSNSYAWSLTTLVLLILIFTALEYAIIKLTLPAMNP
jgi:hypothetical protein